MKFALLLSVIFASTTAFADLTPVTLADLAGNWKAPCAVQNGGSEASQLSFTARGEITNLVLGFVDANCGSVYFTEVSKFDFSINAGGLSATATPFDAVLEFDSAAAVTGANQANSCGKNNWAQGVQQTIIRTACFSAETVNLQIGKVDANTLRITICEQGSGVCQSMDYFRSN